MATLDINNPKYYDPFIKTLNENNNINNHTENANLIVHNFGNDTQKNVMKEILKHHKQEGYLSYFTSNLEYYLLVLVLVLFLSFFPFYILSYIYFNAFQVFCTLKLCFVIGGFFVLIIEYYQ